MRARGSCIALERERGCTSCCTRCCTSCCSTAGAPCWRTCHGGRLDPITDDQPSFLPLVCSDLVVFLFLQHCVPAYQRTVPLSMPLRIASTLMNYVDNMQISIPVRCYDHRAPGRTCPLKLERFEAEALRSWSPLELENSGSGAPWSWSPLEAGDLWIWSPVELESSGAGDLWIWSPVELEPCGAGDLWSWSPLELEPSGAGDLWIWSPVELEPSGAGALWKLETSGSGALWSWSPLELEPSGAGASLKMTVYKAVGGPSRSFERKTSADTSRKT